VLVVTVSVPVAFTAEVTWHDDRDEWSMDLVVHTGGDERPFTRRVEVDVSGLSPGAFPEGVAVVGLMQAFERAFGKVN
jgi:hypothetical protein